MARTTAVTVIATATPLPETLTPTRRTVIVENRSLVNVWVGYSEATLVAGEAHLVAPGTAREFPGGAPIWGIADPPQGGGLDDNTIVSEVEL